MPRPSPLVLCVVAGFGLAACSPDPSIQTAAGGPRATLGAATGAVIGTAVGVNTGSTGSRAARAATGGIIGAMIGGATGSVLDRQAAELQGNLSGQSQVVNSGSALVVTLPQDILFDTGSATLRPDLIRDLNVVAQSLLKYPDTTVEVAGHTDNTGSAAYNRDLSQRRAVAVADVLRSAGVPSQRIKAFGRGEDFPIASNLTPEGRALNRRVEITIRPIQ